jgi:putative CocE/NonD family hydrolase
MPYQRSPLVFAIFAVLSAAIAHGAASPSPQSEPLYRVKHETKVPVPMRDGVKLAAEIFRPDAPGTFPVLMLHRYFREGTDRGEFFAPRGYVVALVDCRGRYDSEGTWLPYVNDPQDGYDAQQWLGRQPWSNGKIGTFGQSYNGFTQVMAAPLASPYLKCMVPQENQQSNFGHLYNDGVMQINVIFEFGLHTKQGSQIQRIFPIDHPHYRRLPLLAAVDDFPQVQHVKDWFRHARYDDYWKSYGIKEKYGRIQAPALFMTGWYDNLCHEGWRNYLGFRKEGGSEAARTGTKIIVGPWTHGGTFAVPNFLQVKTRWYDYWLKGIQNGNDHDAPIRIYVMGADKWRDEREWPLARTRFTPLYLASSGRANSLRGDGRLQRTPHAPREETRHAERDEYGVQPDRFVYDPENPVYTLGGQISTHADIWGPRDRRVRQERDDVLVYTTEPLEKDLEVTGPVELTLFAASSAVDTDFTATLTDVNPDGRAIHICEGIRGVAFRDSLEHPTPIEPGKVYPLSISLWETSMVFKAGHRIRLEVSSSNFPRYARNQNTGLPLGTSAEMRKAQQRIYHDADHPSRLILPVIP